MKTELLAKEEEGLFRDYPDQFEYLSSKKGRFLGGKLPSSKAQRAKS